jgi:hypothetical protein
MLPDEQQERVRSSFAKQGLMTTLGATLDSVSPGMVEIALTPHPAISQQHGFVHGAQHILRLSKSPATTSSFQSLPRIGGARDTERNYHRHSDASNSHRTSPVGLATR